MKISVLIFLLMCSQAFGLSEVVRYIDTGSAGGDGTTAALTGANAAYATGAAWNTGEATDLTSDDNYHTVYCAATGGTADDPFVIGTAWTTDATRDITVIGSDFPSDGILDTTKYNIYSNNNGNALQLSEAHINLYNLQVRVLSTSGDRNCIYSNGSSVDIYIEGCIVVGSYSGTASAGKGIYSPGSGTINVANCTATGFVFGTDNGFTAYYPGATNMNIYNSVAYGCRLGVWRTGPGVCNVYNCAVGNCTYDLNTIDGTVDYCISDDGTGTNSLDAVSGDWDNEFTDANSGDFTPVSGGNILVAGDDDPSSGLYSTDIIDASYTVGVWARGAYSGNAAPSSTVPKMFIISDNFWEKFVQEGIKGRWRI